MDTPHGIACVYTRVYVRVFARVHVCVCACKCAHVRVKREISFLIQDNTTLHNEQMLYMRPISLVFIMWDFVLF